jgi:hypothetical protein
LSTEQPAEPNDSSKGREVEGHTERNANGETVEGELVEDPQLRKSIERTIDFYFQQNVQQHLHVAERPVLPDAKELERLNEVVPGMALDIRNEWKTEAATRRHRDREIVRAQIHGYRDYQRYVFILLFVLIATGAGLVALDKNVIGLLIALTGIIPIVARALLGITSRGGGDENGDGAGKTNVEPSPQSPSG